MTAPDARPSFTSDILATLDAAEEVRIETARGEGSAVHRTIIWIVVDEGDVFVRSVRGPRGRWYRELVAAGSGAVHVGRRRLAVRAVDASDPTAVERCSRALGRKYARDPALRSMLRPETLATTVKLVPDIGAQATG